MDRDKRWDRIKQAYDMFIYGKGKQTTDILKAIKESYNEGITDEFIKPVVMLDKDGSPVGTIKQGDVVICFNFRSDRMRQITSVLSQKDMPDYDMKAISNLFYVTMTIYYEVFKNIHLIFEKENLKNTIGEVISKAGKKQIRIAETEKYAHVTFFFSGGREDKFNGEKRILIPSPKVSTYDLKPSMSAFKVKDAIIRELNKDEADFICLNFANADMVGHTGVYDAIVEAVQTVDKCVKKVSEAAVANNYSVVIIADHGNAEFAINDDGTPNTAHTTNLVPCILIDRDYKNIKNGKLADVAPTILTLMNIDIPKEMTGQKLI
jgi:2,3-bisphosphoglycerate-independent phosphoglycerate mutase